MIHLHIHTDCEYFAGCERLLPHFWNSKKLNGTFRITFTYRKSKRYEKELQQFLPKTIQAESIFNSFQLKQISFGNRQSSMGFTDGVFRMVDKACAVIFLYPLFFYELSKLIFFFLSDRPNVLHINNGGYPGARSARAAACAGKICRIPLILMVVNNMAVPRNRLSRLLDSPIDFLVRRSVSIFVTASTHANETLIDVLGLKREQTQVIPNAVETPNISESRLSIRESMACDSSSIVIGVVAVLEERKGHLVLIDAMSIVLNDDPSLVDRLKVWIIGDGPLDFSLKIATRKIGNGETIQFLGYRYDYLNLMSAMDVAVLTSISDEDSPLSTIEAMSLGIPIIVSDFGGLSDQVVNNENGFLFPVGDASALADALVILIKDQELRTSMGQAALSRYQSDYSVNQFISNYLNLYTRNN